MLIAFSKNHYQLDENDFLEVSTNATMLSRLAHELSDGEMELWTAQREHYPIRKLTLKVLVTILDELAHF